MEKMKVLCPLFLLEKQEDTLGGKTEGKRTRCGEEHRCE